MTNQSILLKAAVLMLLSINFVHATKNPKITDATPDSRYTVHEPHTDGTTVTDTETGLMWQQCSVGQTGAACDGGGATPHNWQEALELAASANMPSTAGYSNWRLPNAKELQTLVAFDRHDPSINAFAFPNTSSADYWSSSPSTGDTKAWTIHFDYGDNNAITRDVGKSVRLVRSPQ